MDSSEYHQGEIATFLVRDVERAFLLAKGETNAYRQY